MNTATLPAHLAFYAEHGAALFPIPAGQKNPTGIVGSFALDCSRDPAIWQKWAADNPGCNFGIVAGASRLIIIDTDTSGPGGREAAWATRCALLAEWGMDPATMPHVQSARGGWHDLFAVPNDVDATTLRQPDAIKGIINVRAGRGYVVAAGSYYDGSAKGEASGPYILLPNAGPPHPAPAALVAHCTRANSRTATAPVGSRDASDVAALITWLAERDSFTDYESWCAAGMAIKLEFGDSGMDIWALSHDATVDADTIETKWNSFATEPTPGCVTLNSLLAKAHGLGWRGTVRKSASGMFGDVHAIATAAGASLPASSSGGVPMMAGQEKLAEFGAPILAEFLAATNDVPSRPMATDYPQLPAVLDTHALYPALRESIDRIIAMAETPKKFRGTRCVDSLSVLSLVHPDTYECVVRRIVTLGCALSESKVKLAAAALLERVEREFVPLSGWIYDARTGLPESDNSDNVSVYLGILGLEIRFNAWLERPEIFGGTDPALNFPEWTYVDDAIVAKLRTRGNRTKTRFRPGKEFFWESLLSLAFANTVDPVLENMRDLEAKWDRMPRLSIWLTASCHVPCDLYHQAVSRNIIGGIVARIRQPGIKHDTMPVLFGPQGTGKSTLAAILAPRPEYFTDSIMFGDASKELVLSLAGKAVVEISEMGMRGNTNPAHVKAMVSRTTDAGRVAYARTVSERPRRNIFIGTTNDDTPLEDPTGNRRFLPVHIASEIDLEWLRANIAQLFGEAAALHTAGRSFDLPREVWAIAADHQEAARSESDTETLLSEWFGVTEYTARAFITAADLVHLSNLAGWRSNHTRSAYMKRLGFRKEMTYFSGRKTRLWIRGRMPVEGAVRYTVGQDSNHRPIVTMRAE